MWEIYQCTTLSLFCGLQAAKQRYANAVPAEPPPDYAGLTATLRFRCPGGETMQRRFRAEETLGILLNFLGSQGYPSSDYKVLTSYPRRDVSQHVLM